MKIKKGDNVIIISGKDKGKTGKVSKAIPDLGKVVISGLNVRKVHKRPTKSGQKGQIIEKSMPVDVSNVKIVDPKTNKPSKVGKKLVDGKYLRVSKASDTVLS